MRRYQAILIVSTLLGCWLGMQAVHEAGHVLGLWLTGGRLDKVVLNPLTISRTDAADNPQPLIVVWAGPMFGALAPLALWGVLAWVKMPGSFLLRFFAGFCLLANGLYISFGSFDQVGDCGVMLRNGSAPWQLWLFGAVTAPFGLWLWHRQGSHFGLGSAQGKVDRTIAWVALLIFVRLIVQGCLIGGGW